MSLTVFSDKVRFRYKSKNWQYQFDEIKELGLLKKKKKYFLENGALISVTAATYYCMLFSNVMHLYYIIPAIFCYSLILAIRLRSDAEFVYFVFVKDVYENKKRTKIEAKDRTILVKQIDRYLDLQFERNLRKTA